MVKVSKIVGTSGYAIFSKAQNQVLPSVPTTHATCDGRGWLLWTAASQVFICDFDTLNLYTINFIIQKFGISTISYIIKYLGTYS